MVVEVVVAAVEEMEEGKVGVEVEVLPVVDLVEPSLGAPLAVEAVVVVAVAVAVVQVADEVAGELEMLEVLVAVLEVLLVAVVLSVEGRLVEATVVLDSELK